MKTAIYFVFGVISSFFVLLPFGYALVHGGERLLWLVPIVLLIFAFPFILKRFSFVPSVIKKVAFTMPFLIILLPIITYLFFIPTYQKYQYKSLLGKVTISEFKEKPILSDDGVILGSSVHITLHVPEPLHVPKESLDFSPINFPEFYGEFNKDSVRLLLLPDTMKISRNGLVEDGSYRINLPAGDYAIDMDTLISGIDHNNQNGLCVNKYSNLNVGDLEKIGQFQFNIKIESRVDIPNRMGIFYFDLLSQKSTIQFNGADIAREIRSMPECPS